MKLDLRGCAVALAACLMGLSAGCDKPKAVAVRAPGEGGLVLAVTRWNEPFLHKDEKTGTFSGLEIELARKVAARLNKTLEVREMTFDKVLPRVKSGEVDFAIASITITESRKRDVDFSIPYAHDGSAFLYVAGQTKPSIPRAAAMRIGTVDTSIDDYYLCSHGLAPICYRSYEDSVAELKKGLLDTVFYDSAMLRQTVAASGGTLALTELVTRENYGAAVRKDYPELLAALNDAIREGGAK